MKRINNKGLTTIEILVTFVITATIVISMYASITNLKNKETIASYKESIITYRDLLTKEIQDDLITKHLISVIPDETNKRVTFFFKNGESKILSVDQQTSNHNLGSGNVTLCKKSNQTTSARDAIIYDNTTYELPNLGSEYVNINGTGCTNVYSLRIKSMNIETVTVEDAAYVLSVKIELWHPDLGNKYSINIVSPIDYK